METALTIQAQPMPPAPRPVADNDSQLIMLWINRFRSPHTRRAYASAIAEFRRHVGPMPLESVRPADVQAFAGAMGFEDEQGYISHDGRSPVTHARILASVKSLFTFATRLGYLQGNPGIATRLPSVPADLAERILPEEAIHRLIHATQNPRDHALLRLMYSTGARVGEIARLEWRHFQASQDNGAFVTLYGKGAKTRTVRVSSATWQEVGALRGDADPDAAVFRSRNKGARLGAAQIGNIVKDAAERAGLGGKVSPHWLRHAHASHSLDRGANVKVVQETLGHSSLAITSRYLHARPEDSSGLYLAV